MEEYEQGGESRFEPAFDPDLQPVLSKEERTWGMLCHLSALAGFLGVPFGHVIAPLVIWLIKREGMPFVDGQGKESLNFQISLTIYALVAFLLVFVVVGVFLLIGLAIFGLVMVILASIKANEGTPYRYPLTIRLVK